MTVREARDNFSDLLGEVFYGKKAVSIEKKGRVFAVVINPDDYQSLKRAAKQEFFKTASDVQAKNKNINSGKAMKDISLAIETVREENYEKRE